MNTAIDSQSESREDATGPQVLGARPDGRRGSVTIVDGPPFGSEQRRTSSSAPRSPLIQLGRIPIATCTEREASRRSAVQARRRVAVVGTYSPVGVLNGKKGGCDWAQTDPGEPFLPTESYSGLRHVGILIGKLPQS